MGVLSGPVSARRADARGLWVANAPGPRPTLAKQQSSLSMCLGQSAFLLRMKPTPGSHLGNQFTGSQTSGRWFKGLLLGKTKAQITETGHVVIIFLNHRALSLLEIRGYLYA